MRSLLASLALIAVTTPALSAQEWESGQWQTDATVATADRLVQFAEIESIGGFTAFSDKTTFVARLIRRDITAGFVRIERTLHAGGGVLVMTGRLSAADTEELWVALRDAEPWLHAEVAAEFQNTDLPDTRVTFRRHHTQLIRASYSSQDEVPLEMEPVSAEMLHFLDLAGQHADAVRNAPLFVYEAAGGLLGMQRTITISRSGMVTDMTLYPGPPGTEVDPYWVQGQASFDQMELLLGLCDGWRDYPETFEGEPSTGDGIDIDATFYIWGRGWTVSAGWPANRPASYQAVLDQVEAMAASLP